MLETAWAVGGEPLVPGAGAQWLRVIYGQKIVASN